MSTSSRSVALQTRPESLRQSINGSKQKETSSLPAASSLSFAPRAIRRKILVAEYLEFQ